MSMRRRLLPVLLVVFAVIALVVAQRRADADKSGSTLQRLTDDVVAAGVPGAVMLLRDGPREWTAAAGLADRTTRRPMQPGIPFRVGSVTKTMIATVVLQLAAENRLQLNDTIERWLPGLVPNGSRITIRHLLAHTSGLADYVDGTFVRRAPSWKPRQVAAYAVDRPPIFTPPGAQFAYASTNYVLLGLVVEEVTNSTLAHELRTRIFEPLSLDRTRFSPGGVRGEHVRGYRAPERQGIVSRFLIDVTDDSAAGAWAAGAVVSTADEVAEFFSALLGGELLRPREVRAMTTATVVPHRYGLGLAIFETPCGAVVGHTGNINGQVTAAWNTRDASRQLVLMVNAFPLSAHADATVRGALESAFCARG
jgi:D-alanyl-D-alanine carboxypeptidase